MPNPTPKDPGKSSDKRSSNRKKAPESKPPALGTVVLFWPFLIFHGLIKPLPKFLRIPVRLGGDLAIAGLYAGLALGIFYYARARPFDMAKVAEMPQRTIVYDRRGEELGRIHGEKRDVIDIANVSQHFIFAILAREDKRFYKHGGVDWVGVARAMVENFKRRGVEQGASTLTMQLARNSFQLKSGWLDFAPKLQELDRKLLEAAVSYRIEAAYPGDDGKQEILQHYLNRIFLGHNIRGLEEASRTYFEKSAKDLTLSESALLAGIVRGPNAFSPFKTIDGAKRERDTTLDRMVAEKFITPEEAAAAKNEEVNIRPEWRRTFHHSYAMDAITRELLRILEEENIEMGGLKVTTTIDNLIQKKAEEALDAKLRQIERSPGYPHQTRSKWKDFPEGNRPPPEYLQGSVVAIENLTGAYGAGCHQRPSGNWNVLGFACAGALDTIAQRLFDIPYRRHHRSQLFRLKTGFVVRAGLAAVKGEMLLYHRRPHCNGGNRDLDSIRMIGIAHLDSQRIPDGQHGAQIDILHRRRVLRIAVQHGHALARGTLDFQHLQRSLDFLQVRHPRR